MHGTRNFEHSAADYMYAARMVGKRREARTKPVGRDGRQDKGAPPQDSPERDRREERKEAGEKRRNGRNTERNGRVRGREGLASP